MSCRDILPAAAGEVLDVPLLPETGEQKHCLGQSKTMLLELRAVRVSAEAAENKV